MYVKEEICKLKSDFKTAICSWAESKINTLTKEKPKLIPASVYMKRGLHNWLDAKDAEINEMIDNVLLFIADKDGNIDTNTIITDAIEMFKQMDTQTTKWGIFTLEYGKGEICITIPRNPIIDMVFGDLGKVKFTTDDLLEVKDMLQ